MTSRDFTGQRRVRRSRAAVPILLLGAVTATVLVFELVKANQPAARADSWPWNMTLLGVPAAASLFAASLVAWVARDQYARSVTPILRYVSRSVATPARDLRRDVGPFRQVCLRNVGPGPAIVTGIAWTVEPVSGGASEIGDMPALRAALERLDFVDGRDYSFGNYSPGGALAADEERLYFECTDVMTKAFAGFEATVGFESTLGDRFVKRVSMLPHAGASSALVVVPPDTATA